MLSFTFGNLPAIKASIADLMIDLRSTREPLERAVREVMLPSFHENFSAEGRPSWVPAARNYGHNLLHDKGALERGATVFANWDFTRETATLNPASLISRVGVKIIHQTGFVRSTKSGGIHNIPARPFIMMQSEDEEKIQEIFNGWLNEKVVARWG